MKCHPSPRCSGQDAFQCALHGEEELAQSQHPELFPHLWILTEVLSLAMMLPSDNSAIILLAFKHIWLCLHWLEVEKRMGVAFCDISDKMVHHWALPACTSSSASCRPLHPQDLASTKHHSSSTYSKPFEPFRSLLLDDHSAGYCNVRSSCSRPITCTKSTFAVLGRTAAKEMLQAVPVPLLSRGQD